MNQAMNDAELCRKNGWGPGTYLAGDEGGDETVIKITAIGERAILCKRKGLYTEREYPSRPSFASL